MSEFLSILLGGIVGVTVQFLFALFNSRPESFPTRMAEALRNRIPLLGKLHEKHLGLLAAPIAGIALAFLVYFLARPAMSLAVTDAKTAFVTADIVLEDRRWRWPWDHRQREQVTLLRGMKIPIRENLGSDRACASVELKGRPDWEARGVRGGPVATRSVAEYAGLSAPCACFQDRPPPMLANAGDGHRLADPAGLRQDRYADANPAPSPKEAYRHVGSVADGWSEFADRDCQVAYLPPGNAAAGGRRP